MKRSSSLTILTIALAMSLSFAAAAQDAYAPPPGADPNAAAAQPAAPPPSYTPQQIDQLTAPIALYPDQLVGQILMASTYPLEIVEAERWQQANPQVTGDQLQAALEQQPWDPSVKSLVAFPQVLTMMNKNLQWTEQLGDAFLGNQAAVSESVQRLRAQAQAAGNLQSTPQQTVTGEPGDYVIAPANPQVVYVPTYNPQVVYGTWAYPEYPPYYFPPPQGYGYIDVGPFAFFATGVVLADWFWGWDRWDWGHHRIDIDDNRWESLNRGRAPHFSGGVWAHNPSHRHGVPYTNPAVRSQFQPAEDAARRNFRGFAPRSQTNVAGPASHQTAPGTHNFQQRLQPSSVAGGRTANPAPVRSTQEPQIQQERFNRTTRTQPQVQSQTRTQSQPQVQQRSAPVFESFSRGPDVRAQSQRGAYSRSTMPASAPARSAAPSARPAAAPRASSGGGGHDGRDGHDHR